MQERNRSYNMSEKKHILKHMEENVMINTTFNFSKQNILILLIHINFHEKF